MTPPLAEPKMIGWTVISRQTPQQLNRINKTLLKVFMDERVEDLEESVQAMNVGIISSKNCQYSNKAIKCHWPCTITMKGSTPISRR